MTADHTGFSAQLFCPKNLLEKLHVAVKVGVDLVGSENRGESLGQFGGIAKFAGQASHSG